MDTSQWCIQNMWLGGQTESFHNVGGRAGGGEDLYNVLTFQKSRGARAHLGGAKAPLLPLNKTLLVHNTTLAQTHICM